MIMTTPAPEGTLLLFKIWIYHLITATAVPNILYLYDK